MNSSDLRTPAAHFASEFGGGGLNTSMIPAIAFALGGGILYSYFTSERPSQGDVIIEEQKPQKVQHLEPLANFNYATTAPTKFRPYKPSFHLTMGIQSIAPNDLILLDSSYKRRLAYRRQLLRSHPNETSGHLPDAARAVSELYTYIVSEHLPLRFPAHFSKSPSGTLVQNHTTTNTYPIIPQSARNALRALGENLDEDFVLLLPGDDGAWRIGAFAVCFPNGFNPAEKLGWKVGEVHAPIPGFEEKLGASLERYFSKMQPGVEHAVQRVNWGIARTAELFTPSGTHVYDGEEPAADETLRAAECCLRVERQTLWKLPETGAIVFGIKTYMTPLSELKTEEGEAAHLADAIEGLGDAMGRYKARDVWGKAVLEYLRN